VQLGPLLCAPRVFGQTPNDLGKELQCRQERVDLKVALAEVNPVIVVRIVTTTSREGPRHAIS
jgi:hypothetical protein